jgi:ATP-dependent protease ClpP protease subunit
MNASTGSAMTFKIKAESPADQAYRLAIQGGEFQIFATGEITRGDAQRLREFAQANGITSAKVYFNSPGGSLIEGTSIGEALLVHTATISSIACSDLTD